VGQGADQGVRPSGIGAWCDDWWRMAEFGHIIWVWAEHAILHTVGTWRSFGWMGPRRSTNREALRGAGPDGTEALVGGQGIERCAAVLTRSGLTRSGLTRSGLTRSGLTWCGPKLHNNAII
jgi:hypothetical protein